MSSPSPHPRGAVLGGRYIIQRKLGSGSMGTVYLVRDTRENRPVALKVIRPDRAMLGAVERLREEFRAMVSLSHPRIARVYDFGYVEGTGLPFYTSEYIPGVPLPPGPPDGQSPQDTLRPILDLLEALAYLHGHGILHLDIHAGNLIVAEDTTRGGVLIDFGLVRSLESHALPLSGASWSALPPEMVQRRKPGPRSDLFLVGRLLLHRLTGRTEGEARLPREIPGWGPRLTLDLERIIAKAVQRSPAQRFASAGEFLQALLRAMGHAPGAEPAAGETALHGFTETVGRDAELREVEAALRDVTRGKSCVLWFVGESGLGKTHLLSEARVRAQLRGLEVIEVAFSELQEEPVLTRALGVLGGKSRGGPRWLEPFAARHGGTPAERAKRVAEAFFVESERPLVLLCDDVEAADDESRQLLRGLVEETARRQREDITACGLALLLASSTQPEEILTTALSRRNLRPLKSLHPGSCRKLLRSALQPLVLPGKLMPRAVTLAAGSPFRVFQIASSLREEWQQSGVLPDTAELPTLPPGTKPVTCLDPSGLSPVETGVLESLAILRRPAAKQEICLASGSPPSSVQSALRSLSREGLVASLRQPGRRLYRLQEPGHADELLRRVPADVARGMHTRLAGDLRARSSLAARDAENLARHLKEAGCPGEALDVALGVAPSLAAEVSYERALRLVEEMGVGEPDPHRRLRAAETMSRLLEETGDHRKGVAILEPFLSCRTGELFPRETVRVRRLLGIHYHRAGRVPEAQAVFEELQQIADPERDIEDLVFVDSEMAEIHIFRGAFDAAESACRRGLERIALLKETEAFPGRMEVVLRASLGHLELRRMSLDRAREELLEALELSRHHGTTLEQASILSNLAITENTSNRFAAARQHFSEAERLFGQIGERRNVIQVATNLAVLAAKLGDREEARLQVERAAQLARHFPGKRLEFSVAYSRGIVHHLFGEVQECLTAFESALPLGRELGDRYLVAFGEVYLAEACLVAGRYRDAQRELKRTLKEAERTGPPVLVRMVHSRLLVVESLLGRFRSAVRSERALEAAGRTDVVLLEAWNDLYVALGSCLQGRDPVEPLSRAREVFSRLQVPAGEGFAALFGLLGALAGGDESRIRQALDEFHPPEAKHALLAVAGPLLRAEAHCCLGDLDAAKGDTRLATSAIVGSPFLELDLRIELLRARIALARHDLGEARRCMHRCVHTRDHLLQWVPAAARKAFPGLARFRIVEETEGRLEKHPRLHTSTAQMRRSQVYEGMLGQTSCMIRLFHAIEEISAQELPVVIRGETGTGKELVARALHHRSARQDQQFLALHCATLPLELFESELFGFEAGAFTGATDDHPGILESIDGGTLLLDEVGQLPAASQAKLLQFLDRGSFRRVGGQRVIPVDVRILASTSRDLEEASRTGDLRRDLYYRLAGVELVVPPLRERQADIRLLARHFLERHAQRLDRPTPVLGSEAAAVLEEYGWPGNVRELEAILLRVQIDNSDSEVVHAADLRHHLVQEPRTLFDRDLLAKHDLDELRTELEREYFTEMFLRLEGDPEKMMRELGLKRSQLYAGFRRLGIDVRELRKRLRK